MQASDIEDFAHEMHLQKMRYLQNKIRPALRYLLRKAKRRIPRRQLAFCDGMGTFTFQIEDYSRERTFVFVTAMTTPEHEGEPIAATRLRRRFPELVKFCAIVQAVTEHLDLDIGVIRLG